MNPYKDEDIIVHVEKVTGGAGFKKNEIWEVCCTRGSEYSTDIVWTERGSGVYPEEVRLATSEEIQWYKQGNTSITDMPKIQTYEIY